MIYWIVTEAMEVEPIDPKSGIPKTGKRLYTRLDTQEEVDQFIKDSKAVKTYVTKVNE